MPSTVVKLDAFNIETLHSAILTTDSSTTPYPINWKPDYWIIVARLSAGYMWVYPSAQKSNMSFRIDRGTWILPLTTDVITIQTVGATGFYDLYPCKNLDGLVVEA